MHVLEGVCLVALAITGSRYLLLERQFGKKYA